VIILSKLADYGVALTVRLSQAGGQQRSAMQLATETQLPGATVAKVLKSLVRAGIVTSTRGAQGGYRLVRSPACITVADVVQAIDGPLDITSCSSDADHQECDRAGLCGTQPHWQRINRAVTAALASVSLADMAVPVPDVGACRPKDFISLSSIRVQP